MFSMAGCLVIALILFGPLDRAVDATSELCDKNELGQAKAALVADAARQYRDQVVSKRPMVRADLSILRELARREEEERQLQELRRVVMTPSSTETPSVEAGGSS